MKGGDFMSEGEPVDPSQGNSRPSQRQIELRSGVLYVRSEQAPHTLIGVIAGGEIYERDLSGEPLNVRFRRKLEAMTPDEKRAFEEFHQALSELYNGPGGP